MLIEFNIENYLSFKDYTRLSMVSAKSFKEHANTHIIRFEKNLNLLKSAIIYGNNASGKSNLINGLAFMKSTVLNSFRDALVENNEKKFPLKKFALNTKNETGTSTFELSFVQAGTKYRYGFEIDYDKVVAEWLFHTSSKEVYLFKRSYQQIEINKSSFKEALGKQEDVRENVLFLSLLATLGKNISSQIIDWFKNTNIISGIHDRAYKRYTIDKLKNDTDFFNWVARFLQYLEISSISTSEDEINDIDFETLKTREKDEEIINLFASLQKFQSKQARRDQLITHHRIYDENNLLVDTIPFNFDKQESEGTKKLIYLLGPWYDTLKNGKVLIIDELDSRLHAQLTQKLINFFHNENNTNAQLICVVHDISLLTKDIFRRDQIWFTEKNQFGASDLFSLADFKSDTVRNKSSFHKNYLQGKYGAVPYFANELQLNEPFNGYKKEQ